MTTVDLRIPIQVCYNNSQSSTSNNNNGSGTMNLATKDMLATLNDKVAKNENRLDAVKDDIIMLDRAVLELRQWLEKQQQARPSCIVNASLGNLLILHNKGKNNYELS